MFKVLEKAKSSYVVILILFNTGFIFQFKLPCTASIYIERVQMTELEIFMSFKIF